MRLIAIKDLFHFTRGELPQNVAFEFLATAVRLIDNDRPAFDNFVQRVKTIGYLSLDKPNPKVDDADDRVMHHPGPVLRSQDMYVGRRALDYYACADHHFGGSEMRHEKRLELNQTARRYTARER
jgi:hypothetical protein